MDLSSSERFTRVTGRLRALLLLTLTMAVATPLSGQSALERPPNMHGTWVGRSGTLYFHFLHRFLDTGPPVRKVINYPTLLLAGTLPFDVLVGARYSTNSELVPSVPNEWEFFGRYAPVSQARGAPVTLTAGAAYNEASRSWDGELEVARAVGPVRLLAAGRAFSNGYDGGEARYALAGGATLRVVEHVALAGDYAKLLDATDAERAAWSAGVQLSIPYTPHTLSLQVSNASTTTLEGSSLGFARRRWGFEFTVPVTLSRYLGSGSGAATESAPAAPTVAGDSVVEVGMTNQLRYTPETLRIRAGQTVVWRNGSDVLHTVTADPSRAAQASSVSLPEGVEAFDSGDMPPGATFRYTFTVPGEYTYFCVPHELAGMIGRIVVTGEGS
jgi:plastocyanin